MVARALATTTTDRALPPFALRVATFLSHKNIYPGKHTMMHHATCQSITARTAALLATKRQLKNRRNASSVIVRAQEFIATDKAPAAAGPYSQGIKVRLGRFDVCLFEHSCVRLRLSFRWCARARCREVEKKPPREKTSRDHHQVSWVFSRFYLCRRAFSFNPRVFFSSSSLCLSPSLFIPKISNAIRSLAASSTRAAASRSSQKPWKSSKVASKRKRDRR